METPLYDTLIIEFAANKTDIEAIRARPKWAFKDAEARIAKGSRRDPATGKFTKPAR